MRTVEVVVARHYFIRQAVMAALCGGLTLMLVSMGLSRGLWPMALFGFAPTAAWLPIAIWDYRRGPKQFDSEGVTRRDGKRFVWSDLKEMCRTRWRLQSGQLGAVNHIDFLFHHGGRVRLYPLIVKNVGEVLDWVDRLAPERGPIAMQTKTTPAARSADSVTAVKRADVAPDGLTPQAKLEVGPSPALPPAQVSPGECPLCSSWPDYQMGRQKIGREEEDTFLTADVGALKFVAEVRPGHNRTPEVMRCPQCGTYYLYEVEYDYLATGSEDEQRLTRLTDAEMRKLLGDRAP